MATIGQKIGRGAREQVRSAIASPQFDICETRMDVDWKADAENDGDKLFFEGFANTARVDEGFDLVEADAYKATLKEYLKSGRQLFLDHDWRFPVGQITDGEIRKGNKPDGSDSGLWVRGYVDTGISPESGEPVDHPGAKQIEYARFLVKKELLRWLSIGWRPEPGFVSYERMPGAAGNVEVEVRRIKRLRLYEISLVTMPMNRLSEISAKDLLHAVAILKGLPLEQTPEEPEGHDEEKHDPARPTYKLVSLEGPKPQPVYRLVNLKGEELPNG